MIHLSLKSRFISLLLVGMLLAGSLSVPVAPIAQAQSKTSTCVKQFGSFVTSLLSTGSANEYWKDLLKRNQCQQADIFSLQDQVDARMKKLREEYYDSCSSDEIPKLQTEIREKKIEIDFVRFIVPVLEDTMTQTDIDAFFKNEFEGVKINLKQTLKKTYVDQKKWVTEERFNALFDGWVTRYEHRFETYLSCDDSGWAEVADKWTEFEDQLAEVLEFFKGTDEDADEQAALAEKERLEKEKEANLKTGGGKNAPPSWIMGFLEKHIALKVNGLEPEKGLQQILEEAEKKGEIVSAQDATSILNQEKENYALALEGADLMARYTLLYKEGSADVTQNLVEKIKTMSDVVVTTTNGADYLAGLKKTSKAIRKKQGKGKAS